MALVLKDRVRQTTTSTGASTITLSGSVAGYQSFSVIGTGNTTYYTIAGTSDWEVGIGTWTSPNQLSRDTILASTNGGAAVNFGAGTKDVFVTLPSERAVYTDAAGNLSAPPAIGGTTPNTITGTTITAKTKVRIEDSTIGTLADLAIDPINYGLLVSTDDGYGYGYGFGVSPKDFFYWNIDDGYGGTNRVTLSAPAGTLTYDLKLPYSTGYGALANDGSSNLYWASFQKPITSGTAAPSGGADGDIYLQYV